MSRGDDPGDRAARTWRAFAILEVVAGMALALLGAPQWTYLASIVPTALAASWYSRLGVDPLRRLRR